MRHLDLFAGISGFTLAAQSLGIHTVQFVEIHEYCGRVLAKNFPNIPMHNDIHTFHAQPNQYELITGGSPCQDLSLAGARTGINGDRSSLWFEMLRVIDEAKPKFVVWENVFGAIYTGGLTTVLYGLYQLGYGFDVEIISAKEIGLDHRRERLFVVAYANGLFGQAPSWANQVGDQIAAARAATKGQSSQSPPWGVPYGLPYRLDRLAVIGNAVIPNMAAIALQRVLFLESWRTK
jgi:DNA (cytosine-5)-methyltransferase 1